MILPTSIMYTLDTVDNLSNSIALRRSRVRIPPGPLDTISSLKIENLSLPGHLQQSYSQYKPYIRYPLPRSGLVPRPRDFQRFDLGSPRHFALTIEQSQMLWLATMLFGLETNMARSRLASEDRHPRSSSAGYRKGSDVVRSAPSLRGLSKAAST